MSTADIITIAVFSISIVLVGVFALSSKSGRNYNITKNTTIVVIFLVLLSMILFYHSDYTSWLASSLVLFLIACQIYVENTRKNLKRAFYQNLSKYDSFYEQVRQIMNDFSNDEQCIREIHKRYHIGKRHARITMNKIRKMSQS